ncbi:hypothetical protein [Sessilibacter sp. MAH4]
MLIQKYKDEGYLFNVNLTGEISGNEIYRGDLVLEFGEVTERGDRKPPSVVAKQAVVYAVADKIEMLVAGLYQLSDLEMLAEHYQNDCAEGAQVLVFVHDIKDNLIISLGNLTVKAVPLDDGMIWNEALELLCIEKSDLKGQSAEEKVVTMFDELKAFTLKGEAVSYADALGKTVEVKHSARGPV